MFYIGVNAALISILANEYGPIKFYISVNAALISILAYEYEPIKLVHIVYW